MRVFVNEMRHSSVPRRAHSLATVSFSGLDGGVLGGALTGDKGCFGDVPPTGAVDDDNNFSVPHT